MARVSAPSRYAKYQPQPRRVSAPVRGYTPPIRENVRISQQGQRAPGMGDLQRYNNRPPVSKAQTPLQLAQLELRKMPDRNIPAGYVSPYNQAQQQRAQQQAAYAAGRQPTAQAQRQYGVQLATPGMGDVQRAGYAPVVQPRYAITPGQMQYGPFGAVKYSPYSPYRWNGTTLPDTLDYQAGRDIDLLRGSLYTDRRVGGEVGDFPYSPEMAYGREPKYTPYGGGGGGYGGGWTDWTGGGGGGGGGGGYNPKPEWYERMLNWKY